MMRMQPEDLYAFLCREMGRNVLVVRTSTNVVYLQQETVEWVKENGLDEYTGLTEKAREAAKSESALRETNWRELIAFRL